MYLASKSKVALTKVTNKLQKKRKEEKEKLFGWMWVLDHTIEKVLVWYALFNLTSSFIWLDIKRPRWIKGGSSWCYGRYCDDLSNNFTHLSLYCFLFLLNFLHSMNMLFIIFPNKLLSNIFHHKRKLKLILKVTQISNIDRSGTKQKRTSSLIAMINHLWFIINYMRSQLVTYMIIVLVK